MNGKCTVCNGSRGEYWMAPVYHNERVREWSRCSACNGLGTREAQHALAGKEITGKIMRTKHGEGGVNDA